ncbi:ShlB/FhaC/HecB family hemolysin secretion/activation protein [Mastigocladopsis repens]|uniref:ShlB/FhaC/HecB family hemolysin secretion/activation protein n=1 Tax=Mastigocladopsis repens TaxID=221287 RepID=UPI00036A483E|nr:ShlB/FhaC/HecB family hemolysin secretion/activation protein [Mastigocladopsis repens]
MNKQVAMNNKCLLRSCTQPWRLEKAQSARYANAAIQAKSAYADSRKTRNLKPAQASFVCVAATSSRLVLTIATLVLSLPIPISAYAVEVAQVPGTNVPNLPPPRDVVPPPSPPPQPQEVPAPSRSPQDLLPTQPPQQPQQEFPAVVPDKFFVTKFEFIGGTQGKGSTVFKDEELLRAIEVFLYTSDSSEQLDEKSKCDLVNKLEKQPPPRKLPRTENDPPVELTFAQLLEARSAITQLYICKEYITSGALIPEQTLSPGGGVVKIQIVEGTLEDFKITGTRRLKQSYIRRRLAEARKTPLKRDRLLQALQLLLQQNPRIDSLSAELAAGTRFGTNVLEVKVDESRTFHGQIILDNSRSPSVGSFQRSVRLWQDNVLGIGDTVNLFYANTDGSNEVDVSYTIPLTPQNTTLTFSYGHTSNDIIEEPFNELDIISESNRYLITLRHPIIQTPTQEFAVGVTGSHQKTQTFLGYQDIGAYPISPGADSEGRTRITAVRFFQEWTQRGNTSVLALRSQFSFGIGALGATINDVGPDSTFFAWRGQAQWVRSFPSDMLFVLRGDVQMADQRLVSLEQFGVGGIASVRGYRQDQILTDNGAFGSIELRVPILRIREARSFLYFIPFVDVGTGWNNFEGADPDPSWLASVGFGLRFQMSDRLDARVDWGIPLISADSNDRTLQENGLYFSVIWNPF